MFDNHSQCITISSMDGRTRRMEILLARSVGIVFAVLIFSVYTLGSGGIRADWVQIAGTLFLFGIVYELLSWLFFNLFRYFAANSKESGEVVTVQAGEPPQNLQ